MKKLWAKINHVDCRLVEKEESTLLILISKQKRVFNPVFTIGTICFICSMIFKANNNADAAAIPLGISTLILISGVWILSGAGKIVFDKTDGKIYCIYNHLGYLRKIYVHSIKAVDAVNLHRHTLTLQKDNGEQVLISRNSSIDKETLEMMKQKINKFIN